jgi:Flp pilus assembly protein TadG
MRFLPRFRNRAGSFADDQKGNTTVEFVLIAPLLFATVYSVFESGWLMTKYMMLDRGLDMAVRDVRLGKTPMPTQETLRDQTCTYSTILRDCQDNLIIEMTAINSIDDIPTTVTPCVDRSTETPTIAPFSTGVRSQMIYVRACAVVDFIFPAMGLGLQLPKDSTGGYALVSAAAFVNEPG